MPIYEYECESCGRVEEALQKFSDAPLTTCNRCSGNLRKLVSHSAFHLKGSGWYVTDYANKSSKKSDGGASTPAESSGESKTATSSGKDSSGKDSTPE